MGIAQEGVNLEKWCGGDAKGWGYDGSDGQKSHGAGWNAYGKKFGDGDEVTVEVDMDAHTVKFTVRA